MYNDHEIQNRMKLGNFSELCEYLGTLMAMNRLWRTCGPADLSRAKDDNSYDEEDFPPTSRPSMVTPRY